VKINNPCWDPTASVFALNIAQRYGKDASTPEEKAWVIDQMVRALTHCPMIVNEITTTRGEVLEIELQGESPDYLAIANDPLWDKGIPI